MGLRSWWRARRAAKHSKRRFAAKAASSSGIGQLSEVAAYFQSQTGLLPSTQWVGDTLEQALEAATWNYACISANAEAAASLPIIVQQRGSSAEPDWIQMRDRAHPLWEFIRRPFGPDQHPRWTLPQALVVAYMQQYLCKGAYWQILPVDRGRRRRFFVDLLHPQEVQVWDDGRRPDFYRVTPSLRAHAERVAARRQFDLAPDQVIHFAFPSPSSLVEGFPPARVSRHAAEIDHVAQQRVKHHLRNKVGPGLVFTQEAPPTEASILGDPGEGLTEEQESDWAEWIARWQKATNDGIPFFLGERMKIVAAPTDIDKLGYHDVRGRTKEDFYAIYRTPPGILGQLGPAEAAAWKSYQEIWWDTALFPLIGRSLDTINAQAIEPYYGPDVRLWFAEHGSSIGLQRMAQKLDIVAKAVAVGYPTNVAAVAAGLDIERVPELDMPNARFWVAGRALDPAGNPVPSEAPSVAESAEESDPAEAPEAAQSTLAADRGMMAVKNRWRPQRKPTDS